MTKQAFHARIWSKLLAFDRLHQLIRPGDRILVAVSGGPDSVCLAHFLHLLSARRRVGLHLMHLHHGLRGRAADGDADFVDQLGLKLSLPVSRRELPVAAISKAERRSLEDAGRKLRYQALLQEARKRRCNKIATGHQMDDQAETVLLHLLRGTNARGLAGIPLVRPLSKDVRLIRPLLALTREEVQLYLRYHGLRYRTDASNRSVDFTRNWIRLRVLPLLEKKNPRIREHLVAIAEDIRKCLPNNPSSFRRKPESRRK